MIAQVFVHFICGLVIVQSVLYAWNSEKLTSPAKSESRLLRDKHAK